MSRKRGKKKVCRRFVRFVKVRRKIWAKKRYMKKRWKEYDRFVYERERRKCMYPKHELTYEEFMRQIDEELRRFPELFDARFAKARAYRERWRREEEEHEREEREKNREEEQQNHSG